MPSIRPFEIIDHTADIGFRCWGADPAELFANAARAMFEIAADLSQAQPKNELIFEVSGEDYETLLVNWLNQLVYAFDADEFAPVSYEVRTITPTSIVCLCQGEKRDPSRHPWKLIIKAVTYHDLEVVQLDDGRWTARVILDV